MNQYPKWLYRADGATMIVTSVEDHATKAADGYLTADEHFAAAPAADPAPPAAAAAPPAAADEPAGWTPGQFSALKASEAVKVVQATEDQGLLASFRSSEENRADGARKTVLAAIADRLGSAADATPVDGDVPVEGTD